MAMINSLLLLIMCAIFWPDFCDFFWDGLGIGIGFTLSLGALGAVREVLGKGTLTLYQEPLFNIASSFPDFRPFEFMAQAPGAFVCLGLMLCIMNLVGD